tara:strand:- start:1288 stop:1482 length:195 start_codon:yes stop_codon:yes gene_type:complete
MATKKFALVKKTKKGVPVKYLTGAKNPKQKEKEILETKKKYAQGKKINIKKVSAFRVKQNKSSG